MVSVKGRASTKAYIRQLPGKVEERLLRGAARAAINVVEAEAADRVTSDEVRENLQTRVRKDQDKVVATLSVKPGWARSVANWLEYGTSPHFISVDADQSGGRSARRVNDLAKGGTLVINGTPVGGTVFHPGARPHPFMRVSLDLRGRDALAAAQSYINANASKLGLAHSSGNDE